MDKTKYTIQAPTSARIGELLVRDRLLTQEQLDECVSEQLCLKQDGTQRQLGQIIVSHHYASMEDVERLVLEQRKDRHIVDNRKNGFYQLFIDKVIWALGKKCVTEQSCDDESMIRSLGKKRYVSIVCKKEEMKDTSIIRTMNSLGDLTYQESYELLKEVVTELGCKGIIINYDPNAIMVISGEVYYQDGTNCIKVTPVFYPEDTNNIQILMNYNQWINFSFERLGQKKDDKGDIVSFSFQEIVSKALMLNASDIHILPKPDHYRVFFRIDTMLIEMPEYLMNIEQGLEFSKMVRMEARHYTKGEFEPDETKVSQLGKIEYEKELGVGVRLEFVPDGRTHIHTDITARIISMQGQELSENIESNLKKLAFFDEDIPALKAAAQRKNGLFIISGVTNSGKSTTLWNILPAIDRTKKIGTVEDPIECVFNRHNIVQHQICEVPDNEKLSMGFQKYIKSFKRGDYDVVFIGEWRKSDGLKDAIVEQVNAGQLIFTTVHISNPFEIYNALQEMFDVPLHVSTRMVLMSLNQILLPKLCDKCRKQVDIRFSDSEVQYLNFLTKEEKKTLVDFRGSGYKRNEKGCPNCREGIKGRTVIYEYFTPTQELIDDIVKNNLSPNSIKKQTSQDGTGRTKLSVFLERLKEGSIEQSSLKTIQ